MKKIYDLTYDTHGLLKVWDHGLLQRCHELVYVYQFDYYSNCSFIETKNCIFFVSNSDINCAVKDLEKMFNITRRRERTDDVDEIVRVVKKPNYAYVKIEPEQVKDLQLTQIDFEARTDNDGKVIVRCNASDKEKVEQLLAAPPTNGLKLK